MPDPSSDTAPPQATRLLRAGAAAGLALFLATAAATGQTAEDYARQCEEYDAVAKKTILELQPHRATSRATLANGVGVELISLNPGVNAWFLLRVTENGSSRTRSYHLENAAPRRQSVALNPDGSLALERAGLTTSCTLLTGDPPPIETAQVGGLPFAAICDGALDLRNTCTGTRSSREIVADFLRDHVLGGDAVVNFVKDKFYKDAFAEGGPTLGTTPEAAGETGPGAARVALSDGARPVIAPNLGLGLSGSENGRMAMGLWYPVAGFDGIFASVLEPRRIDPAVLDGPGTVNRLDSIEGRATAYFVAFDLGLYTLGYTLGTDHPRLDWSPRPPASVRPRGLPGPDGVGDAEPLVRTGMVRPALVARTVATFAGGFKRQHGAFKWGPFSQVNAGSHYGFVEQGAVFSKLQPGLSTLYGLTDGTIAMKTWAEGDDDLLPRLVFARQNGVPLIEPDPATGEGVPGQYVTQWGAGNWSGSAKAELRTLRAGACLKAAGGTDYLVYGYFSTATPSAMARAFQAYGCRYAMLLDMNAPELTYLALYLQDGGQVQVEHLVPEMAASDTRAKDGSVIPKFLGTPDSRDLFHVYRREDR